MLREIQGYRQVLGYVLAMGDTEYATEIRAMHYMMLSHGHTKSPGRYRKGPVYVHDERNDRVVYEGPDAADVPRLVDALVDGLHPGVNNDPVVRSAMAHLNLVMIHPFRDGNGRMARALATLVLTRSDIGEPEFSSIEGWLGANTEDYYSVLAHTGHGSWPPRNDAHLWLTFNLRAHHMQAQTVARRVEEAGVTWTELDALLTEHDLPERAGGDVRRRSRLSARSDHPAQKQRLGSRPGNGQPERGWIAWFGGAWAPRSVRCSPSGFALRGGAPVATRDMFSDDELAQLRVFPEPSRAELIRFFALTPGDEAFVRRFRSRENVLGTAVQLCTLPWLGFVPDDVPAAPAAAVARLSEKLGIPVGELRGYGARGQTRTDHLRAVAAHLGWHQVDGPGWKDLEEFLFARAMEHDWAKLLFRQACEYLSSSRLVRPGVVNILERVATARERARDETWARLEPMLTGHRRAELDRLLAVDSVLGRTRLTWLGTGPVAATPASVKAELEKLAYLRGMDADMLDLSVLAAERRRFLAGLGRRLTAQNLARRDDDRKYPILLTLVAQSAVDVLDEVLLLFDQALSGREAAARERLTQVLAERARGGEDRQALLDDILRIVLDPDVTDDQGRPAAAQGCRPRADAGGVGDPPGAAAPRPRAPGADGRLDGLLAPVRSRRAGRREVRRRPGMDDLLQAASILAGLYATKARKVPDGAPDSFVPARWAGYLEKAARDGDVTAYRHYWELCVLMALRDGLRSGDVHVPGSRRYADPASFLLTPQQWEPQRLEFCHLVGKPAAAADALALASDELHAALSDLEAQLARGGGKGEVPLNGDGELVIPPLTAEDVPAEAEALRDELAALLPRVPIASVLVEIDARTGFTDRLTHAGGKVTRPPHLRRNLLYVIIAEATNMGLGAMAESCGVPYDTLAWTSEWYFRAETLEAANAAIVNYHHRLPMTQAFGTGTLSSSDGQRFPVKGKSLTARHLSRYFARGQGISTYTHVSDQHSTFDTKVIAATSPENPYVLDGILGNQTDLLITEHATDTHGATLANFAMFDLVGLHLSPRIRDLGRITLYRTGPRAGFAARYPSAGHLLTRRLNEDLITDMWDDLLRVAASVKGGHAAAALVVGKLCSSRRQQNALAAAIKEYGALRRTVYAARYLADETYRRRIGRQLNKGENLHALKRTLAYAGEGALRRHHHEQQAEQMWCLTLATNSVVTWTTEYNGLAVTALRRGGHDIDDAVLAHIWPTHHENIHFYGTHSVDVDGELAQLGSDGYRPLRAPGPAPVTDEDL